MHVEPTRAYPAARHRGFDYFMDFGSRTDWTTLDVVDPEAAAWHQPGDAIQYARMRFRPRRLSELYQG